MNQQRLHFSFLLTYSPFSTGDNQSASEIIGAVLDEGHLIDRVFFYQDAVLVANKDLTPPQGQIPLFLPWANLHQTHKVSMQVCIANALRRGILDQSEADRYSKQSNLHSAFELAGLGEIAEALHSSDRVVTL